MRKFETEHGAKYDPLWPGCSRCHHPHAPGTRCGHVYLGAPSKDYPQFEGKPAAECICEWDDGSHPKMIKNLDPQPCPLCHEIINHKISCPRVNVDDPVHHPSHYTTGKIEVADFIDDQDLGRWEARIISYVCRARYKDNELLDLKKARWYLDRKIAQLEKEKA